MKLIKDFRNDLLKRQEVSFSLEAEKNPGFDDMKKQVSEQAGKPKENIDVYNIKGSFGSHEFKVDAYVYDSKDDLEKFMQKKKVKKEAGKKEVKVEEEKVEDKSEEKAPVSGGVPAEEKPEQEEKAVGEQKQAEEEAKEP